MKRRNFIRNTGITATAGILTPTIVSRNVSGKNIQGKSQIKNITRFNQRKIKVTLDEPVIVAQAPSEMDRARGGWGRWQFPHIARLANGQIQVRFSIEPDSAYSYGKPEMVAYSTDNGKTWRQGGQKMSNEVSEGILLTNGDRLKSVSLNTQRAEDFELPKSIYDWVSNYGFPCSMYRAKDLPKNLQGWRFSRLPAGKSRWIEENAIMHIPNELRVVKNEKARHTITPGIERIEQVREGALPMPFIWGRITVAPDKSLWAVTWAKRQFGEELLTAPVFLRSIDNGHTWYLFGEIQYKGGDDEVDPYAKKRGGFSETDYNFMPDGSAICLMRTSDGNGVGPLYITRSVNYWRTWSKPKVFDNFGKWPHLLTLENGVTLASYGQSGGPGYFVIRATSDMSGLNWQAPIKSMLSPGAEGAWDTCGHTEMVSIDANHAIVVYSDFNFPDSKGGKRKTILTRRIEVSI